MASASDLNALMVSLSFWELAGYISFSAVTIGVAGEFIHDFVPWLRRKSAWWDTWGSKVSGLVLIVALAAELITQVMTNSRSGQVIAFLRDQAAETRERAALFEKEAEQLRLGLGKVYGQLSRRRLSDEEMHIVSSELSGKDVTVNLIRLEVGGDVEPELFFLNILSFLGKAHIKFGVYDAQKGAMVTGLGSYRLTGGDRTVITAFEKAGLLSGHIGVAIAGVPPEITDGILIGPKTPL
jgi:hypothetical protein